MTQIQRLFQFKDSSSLSDFGEADRLLISGTDDDMSEMIHLDADAFFASVEQAADRRLRGRPVAVGSVRRGIIASASYEARRYGIYTPMPTSRALRACPGLILVPGDFEKYERFSEFMFSYAYDFTPAVEVTSIDEGYFDLAGNRRVDAWRAAGAIRRAIAGRLKISVSEGVASNKLVSQIASKLNKPGAFLRVDPGEEERFLAPLEVKWLPGVGPKQAEILRGAGLTRIGQVARMPLDLLGLVAGGGAERLRQFARGIDSRPVVSSPPAAKSYGAQETFDQDTADDDFLRLTLRALVDRVVGRMREDEKAARTLGVKIRYGDMDEAERGASLEEPGDLPEDFYGLAERLWKKAWERRVRLRMIRVKLSGIYDFPSGGDLFTAEARRRHGALQSVVREVQGRYGAKALMRGHEWVLAGTGRG